VLKGRGIHDLNTAAGGDQLGRVYFFAIGEPAAS
jgi:hypothetical protein